MDCSLPGSCVHGILQVRILEWVTISSSRDWTQVSCIAGRFFTIWTTSKPDDKLVIIICSLPKVSWYRIAQGDYSVGRINFEHMFEDKACLGMLVDDNQIEDERKRSVFSEELLPMILVHAFTHWFIGVTTLLHYVLDLVLGSGEKKSPIPPQNPFSLLPCTLFPLNSRCASSLCAPALNVWSFQLHLLVCFVERSEKLLLQQIFCLRQSLQEPGDLAPPRGTSSALFALW